MKSHEEKTRAAIAEQAGEWFVSNDEGCLDAREAAALAAWLKASPLHIEEFLGVSAIARDLKATRYDPQYSIQAILARARAEEDSPVESLSQRSFGETGARASSGWFRTALATAACTVLSLGLIVAWNPKPASHPSLAGGATLLHLATSHGEQLTHRLADGSVLHLNTDSAVTVRYRTNERLVTLDSGQAEFEVVHEPHRVFRVVAGAAEVLDLGTRFDVRLDRTFTVVTVVQGRVAVGPTSMSDKTGTSALQDRPARFIQLDANQQIRVTDGEWPAMPIGVDAQRTTAWLRREIEFDHEPLERVAAEYNRYASIPVEIETPALRSLQVTGVFATDDSEAFVAFLRSLKGVRVEVTASRIRVSRD